MNKITISEVSMPQIHLELCRMIPIMNIWQEIILHGGCWRLYWNSKSGAGVYLDGEKIEFDASHLYLLPPGCNLKTWCRNPEVIQFYIHFEAMQYQGSHEALCTEIALNDLRRALLTKITGALGIPDQEWQRNLWCLALVADALTALAPEILNEQNQDRRFTNLCNDMRLHFNEEITLEKMAGQVNMAPNAFIRKFRELYQTTPYQYLLHLRYVHAARLLMTRNMTLKEIAAAVGFRDSFQFSRGFKAVYGISPDGFRKRDAAVEGAAGRRESA